MIPDIGSLLLKLQRERYLSIDSVNEIRASAKFLHPDLSKFDDYLTGSIYVHFYDAMLKKSLLVDHSPPTIVVLYYFHSGKNNNPAQYDCSINWPRTIYVYHMMNNEIFGISFVMIPGFDRNKRDIKLLWLTCTTLCHCKEVLYIVDTKVSNF